MTEQLTSMGLDYQVFNAVDGKARANELIKNVDKTAYERNMGAPLLPGKMGVYASHVSVWQEFLASDHNTALILEDDVVFHDDFKSALNTAMRIGSSWDLIRFNCIRAKIPITQCTVDNYTVNAYIGPFTGNAAYLIHRSTVEKILPNIWPQTRALDHELNRFFVHNYRQFGLEPWASHPDDGGTSTITGDNFALVKKPHWSRRLAHYRLKAANYLRRTYWLWRNGYLKKPQQHK